MRESLAEMDVQRVTAEIIAAVKTTLKESRDEIVVEASDKSLQALEQRLESKRKQITSEGVKASVKRVKTEQPLFKSMGNKNQFEHNLELMESINTAKEHIEAGRKQEGLDELENGKKLISKRQKLIRLAHREENGWHVVKEYLADDLASDSDDEKCIARVRKSAAYKKKSDQAKKQKNNFRSSSTKKQEHQNPYDQNQKNGFSEKEI